MSQVEQCLCRAFAGIEGDVWNLRIEGDAYILHSYRDILFKISVKQAHAPGGIKRLTLARNGLNHRGGCSLTIP